MPSAAFEDALERVSRWMLRIGSAGLVGCVLAAGQLHAQGSGIRPGCWDLRVQIDTIAIHSPQDVQSVDAQKLPSLDQLMQQTLSRLTPEQRAHIDEAQLRQEIAASLEASRKALEQAQALVRKPVVARSITNGVKCSPNPLGTVGIPASAVQHSDGEHFSAIQRQSQANGSVTVTTVGKWISEDAPHMPYSPAPTDLNGYRPKGPHDVMWLDQNRIVAVIDGQQLTALEAFLVLNLPPRHILDADVYKHGWSGVLQHNYMYWAVSNELDPTRTPAQRAKGILLVLGVFSGFNTGTDEGSPADTRVYGYHYVGQDRQEYDREQRYWNVYLSRAASASGKQSLVQQAQDKYRVNVVDPDFFAGRPGP
jgi:hypothetical protein